MQSFHRQLAAPSPRPLSRRCRRSRDTAGDAALCWQHKAACQNRHQGLSIKEPLHTPGTDTHSARAPWEGHQSHGRIQSTHTHADTGVVETQGHMDLTRVCLQHVFKKCLKIVGAQQAPRDCFDVY